jgi:hypothetical protein
MFHVKVFRDILKLFVIEKRALCHFFRDEVFMHKHKFEARSFQILIISSFANTGFRGRGFSFSVCRRFV